MSWYFYFTPSHRKHSSKQPSASFRASYPSYERGRATETQLLVYLVSIIHLFIFDFHKMCDWSTAKHTVTQTGFSRIKFMFAACWRLELLPSSKGHTQAFLLGLLFTLTNCIQFCIFPPPADFSSLGIWKPCGKKNYLTGQKSVVKVFKKNQEGEVKFLHLSARSE